MQRDKIKLLESTSSTDFAGLELQAASFGVASFGAASFGPASFGVGGSDPSLEEESAVDVEVLGQLDRLWNVIVWNDPINLMSYVTYVFQKLFGYSLDKARKLMLEVHQEGKSVVATVERERAEIFVSKLHAFGLQATLEKTS